MQEEQTTLEEDDIEEFYQIDESAILKEKEASRQLYKWQEEAIHYFFNPRDRCKVLKAIFQCPTGSGKTTLGIEIIKEILIRDPDAKILIVVPKNVILESGWYKELYDAGINLRDIGVYYGAIKEYSKITITNMQNLQNIDFRKMKGLVLDECFSGDTRVLINNQGNYNEKSIKEIVETRNIYDYKIVSYNIDTKKYELKKIIDFIKIPQKREILDIELENGDVLAVTPDQLIFDGENYIKASKLKEGEYLSKIEHNKITERVCLCGCKKTFLCNYNSKKKFILEAHSKKFNSKKIKGKTWEEIMGEKKAKEYRAKRKKTRTGKKLNRIKPSYKKGKSYEEIYGDRAESIKAKDKSTKLKTGSIWTQENIIKAYLSIPDITRTEWINYRKEGILPDKATVIKLLGSLENLSKISNKKFKDPVWDKREIFREGKNEKLILDFIQRTNKIHLIRQYKIPITPRKSFFVDGYDYMNNVVYEVYEQSHYYGKNKIYDLQREEFIKDKLSCEFIILDEKEYLNKIFNGEIYVK